MSDFSITYTRLEPVQIASITRRIDSRGEILPLIDALRAVCAERICGDPTVIFHGGAVRDGFLVEAAFPVSAPIETDTVHTRALEAAPALITLHRGAHTGIRETVLKAYDYIGAHAWTTSLFRREIYRALDPARPENNVTEVQMILHEWDQLLGEGVEEVLGAEARRNILQGIESITPDSTFEEYAAWIQGAIDRLDRLTDDPEMKCRIVSRCAHIFPQERIDHLRDIYRRGGVDDVLREMYTDDLWYEKPARRGNVIYMQKIPYDLEAYRNATTDSERRRAACHCAFVHPYLDEKPSRLSSTFCFCGAGWYTRLWEGILGQPVKIEHVETLLRGNDHCTLTITLPLELAGECLPEKDTYD